MRTMNYSRTKFSAANVYLACHDEYRQGVRVDVARLTRSRHHEVHQSGKDADVVLDEDASDIEDMYIAKGTAYAADEVVQQANKSKVVIPIPLREQVALPSADLLNVLHYYASHKLAPPLHRSCDETALLTLGILVELWVDDLVGEDDFNLFLEEDNEELGILQAPSLTHESNDQSDGDGDGDSDESSNESSESNLDNYD